jgi:hypothetical protein
MDRARPKAIFPGEIGLAASGLVESGQAAIEWTRVMDVVAAAKRSVGFLVELRLHCLQPGSVSDRSAPWPKAFREARIQRECRGGDKDHCEKGGKAGEHSRLRD